MWCATSPSKATAFSPLCTTLRRPAIPRSFTSNEDGLCFQVTPTSELRHRASRYWDVLQVRPTAKPNGAVYRSVSAFHHAWRCCLRVYPTWCCCFCYCWSWVCHRAWKGVKFLPAAVRGGCNFKLDWIRAIAKIRGESCKRRYGSGRACAECE